MTDYPTQELLLLSFSAYRVNKGYEKTTRRHSESPPTFSNKELIAYTISSRYEQSPFIPEDFTPLKVTEADKKAKESADKHMRRYTMLAMGDLPDFESDLFSAYSSERMPIGRIGLLAYLPAFVDREIEAKMYKQRLKNEFEQSKYILHNITEATDVEILKVIPLNNAIYDAPAFLHFGCIGKDLVCFSKKEKFAVGKTYEIVGKIKGQDKERDSGLPMTRLNYVKVRNAEAV